tara:strand:+ start:3216 stop:3551 length:336 start_codon:yes stop_codon:yes gene_type:complete
MAKIINTFVELRQAQLQQEEEDEDILASDLFEQSIDLGRYALDLIETGLEEYGVNFDYKENPDLKGDMFVVLNLIVSSLLRDQGIKHVLQEDLDILKDRIMELQKYEDDIT